MTHPLGFLSTAAGLTLLAAALVGPARAADGAASSAQGPVALVQHVSVQETPQRSQPAPRVTDRREAQVRRTQASLAQLGFEPGPADGKLGPRTRRAIRAFQDEQQLPADGEVSAALLGAIASALRDGRPAPVADVESAVSAPDQVAGSELAPAPAAAETAEAPAAERTGGVRLIAAAEAATPEPHPAADAIAPAADAYGLGDAIAESWTIMTSLSGAVVDMVQARVADATR